MAKDTAVASIKKSSKTKHSEDTDGIHDDQPMTDVKSESKDKKKRKKSSEDGESTKKKKRRHDSDDETTEKKKSKKKRVSFGPGTKTEDGSGDETSDTVTGEEETQAEPTPEIKSDQAAEAEAALDEMRKRKREKKKERKSGAAPSTAQIHETPILSYLNRYYKDRESWKFQKNRETNLFKHMYSMEHVPAPFNAALLAYMQGLKGDMAKMRLSQGAATILKADTEQAVDAEFEKAVEEFRSILSEGGDVNETGDGPRLQKRQRAELVFFAVTGKLFTNEEMKEQQKAAAKERAKEAAKLKKRKNRTAVVISSSESEDTSDDDSDSSDDEENKKKPVAKPKSVAKPAPADGNDDTSSSGGSDSSSSDSDGDDEAEAPAPKKPVAKATKAPKAKKVKPAKPAKVEEPVPSKNKKKQKRKQRTVNIEISSSESDSD